MRKYQILKEQSTLIGEIKVYRIQALRNIHTRLGMIPAGQLGAFIQRVKQLISRRWMLDI